MTGHYDPLAANLARWEEQVDIHVGSDFYRVKEFLGGESFFLSFPPFFLALDLYWPPAVLRPG